MPTIELTNEELQGLITLAATGSGPGINWILCNGLLQKAQAAAQKGDQGEIILPPKGNSEDHDAPRARR